MIKKEVGSGSGGWARVCDTCRAAASVVYCRADVAYLCARCDARIHAANLVASRHERVWVCEACESAPAAFTCKADAAALCSKCDSDIHSANPLARRHHRVPIVPISGCLYGPAATQKDAGGGFLAPAEEVEKDEDEEITESWLLLNPGVKNNSNINGYLFGGDDDQVDEYLDLVEYNSCSADQVVQYCADQYNNQNCSMSSGVDLENQVKGSDGSECVVPVQNVQLEMEYDEASKGGFSYAANLSHSVSLSSMDASIVPDSTMSDISNSYSRPPKGTIDLFSSPPLQMPAQFTPLDREARVLRYREKRKMRKFEKTIRYASRKAYAETRPRIKGRFAKRTDVEVEVGQMFSSSILAETDYGIVPSF